MSEQTWQRRLDYFREQPSEAVFRSVTTACRLTLRSYCRWQLARAIPLDFLEQRPDGAFGANYPDLWFLYDLVRKTKPRTILEFGGGCSTVVMGYALRDNEREGGGPGKLFSVDADEEWAAVTASTVPDELKSNIDVIASGLRVVTVAGTAGYEHEVVPGIVPDLVYLDGPALTREVGVAVDVVNMEHKLRPGFRLVVDGRTENVGFLRRVLQRKYEVHERGLASNTVFELLE